MTDGVSEPASTRVPPVVQHPVGPPLGSLVFLHGATQTGAQLAPPWRPLVDDGWVVVTPTGPSPRATSMASWDDVDLSTDRVGAVCAGLPRPLVLGGFSQGGRQAARMWSAGEPVRPDGLLLIAPSFPDGLGAELLAQPAGGGPVLVLVGAEDRWCGPARRWAVGQQERGADVRLDIVAGLGHELPPDLIERASRDLLARL